MLISNKVEIVFNPSNKFHFLNLGYDYKNGDKIFVPIQHLTKGSNVLIDVKCDKCEKSFSLKYKNYYKRINKNDLLTCNKCKTHNIKSTKKIKYGDENYCNEEKIKLSKLEKYGDENYCNVNKIKETKFNKYGDENYCNKNKIKETKFNKYGDENYCNVNKIKETKFNKYGDENYCNIDKIKETCLINFGCEHPLGNVKILEKIKESNIKKYGCENVFQNEEIKNKIKKTCLEKYGYENYAQTDDFWEKFKRSIRWREYKGIKYQTSYELKFLIFCEKNNIMVEKYVPKFKYELENKICRYIPDFFIKNKNLIIEIKSTYWLKAWEKKNIEKKKSVINSGYEYIMILDNDFKEFERLMMPLTKQIL